MYSKKISLSHFQTNKKNINPNKLHPKTNKHTYILYPTPSPNPPSSSTIHNPPAAEYPCHQLNIALISPPLSSTILLQPHDLVFPHSSKDVSP